MEKILTAKELKDISLGYIWNQDMGLEEFVKSNPNISPSNVQEIYNLIEGRYIDAKYS